MSAGLRFFFWILFVAVFAISAAPFVPLLLRLIGGFEHFPILVSREVLEPLRDTFKAVFLSLLLGLILTLPLSWLLVRTDLPARHLLRRVFLFPYMLPPYLYGIAWMMLAIPRIGLLNRWMGGYLSFNIYSLSGLVWVLACAYLPLLLASICSALESMDPSLEEAARVSGAGPIQTACRITFPCLVPAIGSASVLFALIVMAAFGIPSLIGDPARIYLLTTRIYSFVNLGGMAGMDRAMIISLWLLFFSVLLVWGNNVIKKRFLSRLIVGKTARHSVVRLGKARGVIFVLTLFFAFTLVVLPIVAIFLSSFLRVEGDLSVGNLTWSNYHYLFFEMPEFYIAVKNSLILAAVSGLACVLMAFFIAYYADRMPGRAASFLQFLASFPFAIPGAVVALAMIVSHGSGWGFHSLALLGSSALLFLAYVSKHLALAVQNVSPALASVHPSLDEAGRVSGAGPWRVIFQILFPLLLPVLFNVYFLTALPILTELSMTILLTGPGLETIGTQLFTLQEYANRLAACAMASLLVGFLILLLFLGRTIRRSFA